MKAFFIAWLRKTPPPEFSDRIWDGRRSLAIKGEALLQGTAHKPERYRRSLPYPALPFSRENCESEIAEDQNNNERSSQP